MKRFLRSMALASALTIIGSAAYAEEQHQPAPAGLDVHFGFPGTQGLNELLVKKGIVTKEELEAQAKKHSMNISGYIQLQGTVIENNDEVGYEIPTPKSFTDEDGFRVRRAKLAVFGNAYEHVKFKLEADFAGAAPRLDDAFIEDDRRSYLIGRLGQFKVPFSLEMLTSDTEIITIERSEVVNQISPGRDAGISFSGILTDGMIAYSVGIFNGHQPNAATTYATGSFIDAGKNKTNDNNQMMLTGRITVKPIEGVSVGLSALKEDSKANDHQAYGIEAQAKYPNTGCTLQAEYLSQKYNDKTSDGFYLAAGHFVVPKNLEAVLKYEKYNDGANATGRDDINWLTLGVNFYIYGDHDAKLMANYIIKGEENSSYDNDTLLAQLQLRF